MIREENEISMKIVVLDGYTENPGDLSWDGFRELGDVTVYDRTPKELVCERIAAQWNLFEIFITILACMRRQLRHQ